MTLLAAFKNKQQNCYRLHGSLYGLDQGNKYCNDSGGKTYPWCSISAFVTIEGPTEQYSIVRVLASTVLLCWIVKCSVANKNVRLLDCGLKCIIRQGFDLSIYKKAVFIQNWLFFVNISSTNKFYSSYWFNVLCISKKNFFLIFLASLLNFSTIR